MLNRSAINMGKANEHGARLEFQCHCSVVRPMLVLGQAQQPSSDAAWTAAACSSGQARQWGHIVVGPGWWQEGGAATCSQNFLKFNGVGAFSGRRRFCRQRSACGDFVNLEDLPAQSLRSAYRGRVACVYS